MPEPLFPRVLNPSWRKNTPRAAGTAVSCSRKPNPGATPSSRQYGQDKQYGQDNPATGYKGWKQLSVRIRELPTRKDGKDYSAVHEFCKREWRRAEQLEPQLWVPTHLMSATNSMNKYC